MVTKQYTFTWRAKLGVLLVGGVLLFSSVACNALGRVDNDAPTQVALENTVAAMQATLAAIETPPVPSTVAQPPPQIIVVTATPTQTPLPSPIPLPTSTPLPPVLSPTAPATNTPVPAVRNETIVVVVTPTVPPSPTPYLNAPVNLAPPDGTVVTQGFEALLQWSWNGLLGPNEYFEVKLRPDNQPRSAYIAQELGEGHDFVANLGQGRYQWTVQVVQGYFINNSGHPDDWVFESFRSPESEPSLIIVHQDDRDGKENDDDDDDGNGSPPSPSHAEAPAPTMPYGLLAGGLAFFALIGVTRRRVLVGEGRHRFRDC